MRRILLVVVPLLLAPLAEANTVIGTISGTCGFYQGSLSNVVYSSHFSGNGSFCTGFIPLGSSTPSGSVSVNDTLTINSDAIGGPGPYEFNSVGGIAPIGYGVFVDFDVTITLSTEFLFVPSVTPGTPAGTVQTNDTSTGGTDDSSGSGSCFAGGTIAFAGGSYNGGIVTIPVTFGQPVAATETAQIFCNQYGSTSWGDEGGPDFQYIGPGVGVYDSNGNFVGLATISEVPEPASGLLTGLGAILIALGIQKNRRSCRAKISRDLI